MITPNQLAKSGTEHAHQTALFAYCAVAQLHGFDVADAWANDVPVMQAVDPERRPAIPELQWFHAIANGGSRGDDARSRAIRGGQLKAEGVKSGVSDCFLPVRRGQWSGLYIEMKKPAEKPRVIGSRGGVSDEQLEFGAFVQGQGFGFVVCYSWREAADILTKYLTGM